METNFEPVETWDDPQLKREGVNNRQLWRRVSAHKLMRLPEPQDDEYETQPDFDTGNIPKVDTDENGNVL